MESDSRGRREISSYNRPAKVAKASSDHENPSSLQALNSDSDGDDNMVLQRKTHASNPILDYPEPALALKSIQTSGVKISVNNALVPAKPAKLPGVKVDSTVELEALMNITVGDPRLSDEGDLDQPIVWRQNVSEAYWKRLIDQEEGWFRPFLYCIALVNGNLVIYELPSEVHQILAASLSGLIMSEQTAQDPGMAATRLKGARVTALPGANIIADQALSPKGCIDAARGYPSIVVEVGVSQSLPSLEQKAKEWFACVHAGVDYVRLVILIKVNRSLDRLVQGHPAVRVSCYLWMRYDPLLHAPLLPFINAQLPAGAGAVVPNDPVCIAEFECGDYAAHAQQNLPANHNRIIRIPRYALYARSQAYEAAYVAAAAQVPPQQPLFPPGSPYHGELTIDLWTEIINDLDFRLAI